MKSESREEIIEPLIAKPAKVSANETTEPESKQAPPSSFFALFTYTTIP